MTFSTSFVKSAKGKTCCSTLASLTLLATAILSHFSHQRVEHRDDLISMIIYLGPQILSSHNYCYQQGFSQLGVARLQYLLINTRSATGHMLLIFPIALPVPNVWQPHTMFTKSNKCGITRKLCIRRIYWGCLYIVASTSEGTTSQTNPYK